jgi:alkylation response protein AidB-like acyl-CoA dehydrogenase
VPSFEHQSVEARLFEMFRTVAAARALDRRVVEYDAVDPPKLRDARASMIEDGCNDLPGLAAARRL